MESLITKSTNAKIIHKITIKSFKEYASFSNPPEALLETTASIQKDLKKGAEALVMTFAEQPIGTVRYKIHAQTLYFYQMGIIPKMQNLGFGKQLIRKVEALAKEQNVTQITCRVRYSVLRNIQFYQSLGYKIDRHEVVSYDNDDRVTFAYMSKMI